MCFRRSAIAYLVGNKFLQPIRVRAVHAAICYMAMVVPENARAGGIYQTIPYLQSWNGPGLIKIDDGWSGSQASSGIAGTASLPSWGLIHKRFSPMKRRRLSMSLQTSPTQTHWRLGAWWSLMGYPITLLRYRVQPWLVRPFC